MCIGGRTPTLLGLSYYLYIDQQTKTQAFPLHHPATELFLFTPPLHKNQKTESSTHVTAIFPEQNKRKTSNTSLMTTL